MPMPNHSRLCASEEISKTIGLFVYLHLCFVYAEREIQRSCHCNFKKIINGQSSGQCRSNNKAILIQLFAHKPKHEIHIRSAVDCNKDLSQHYLYSGDGHPWAMHNKTAPSSCATVTWLVCSTTLGAIIPRWSRFSFNKAKFKNTNQLKKTKWERSAQ